MPFYQEDWWYGNDSRYGLSSTTRFSDPLRHRSRRRASAARDSGITEEELPRLETQACILKCLARQVRRGAKSA
jgi:hypothetical protein